jgi:hypothetical protein
MVDAPDVKFRLLHVPRVCVFVFTSLAKAVHQRFSVRSAAVTTPVRFSAVDPVRHCQLSEVRRAHDSSLCVLPVGLLGGRTRPRDRSDQTSDKSFVAFTVLAPSVTDRIHANPANGLSRRCQCRSEISSARLFIKLQRAQRTPPIITAVTFRSRCEPSAATPDISPHFMTPNARSASSIAPVHLPASSTQKTPMF